MDRIGPNEKSGPNRQNRTKWEQGGPNKNEWIE